MRVISGKAKGKTLKSVPGDTTRPILDRVKTALFDIIRDDVIDCTFLDLFAGTGNVGIEALSNGAKLAYFTDIERTAIEVITENLNQTKLIDSARIVRTDAYAFIKNTTHQFDIIYVAPPQYKGIWVEVMNLISNNLENLKPKMVIVQIDPLEYEMINLKGLIEKDSRTYGNTKLIFYKIFG